DRFAHHDGGQKAACPPAAGGLRGRGWRVQRPLRAALHPPADRPRRAVGQRHRAGALHHRRHLGPPAGHLRGPRHGPDLVPPVVGAGAPGLRARRHRWLADAARGVGRRTLTDGRAAGAGGGQPRGGTRPVLPVPAGDGPRTRPRRGM
ncbi:MAG: hypothetical protein AVDCRST_MAG47-1162, partial [uncultured Nocardioidaceae bacterium]